MPSADHQIYIPLRHFALELLNCHQMAWSAVGMRRTSPPGQCLHLLNFRIHHVAFLSLGVVPFSTVCPAHVFFRCLVF